MGCVSWRRFGDTQSKHIVEAAQTDRTDGEKEGRWGVPGNGVQSCLLLQIVITKILLAAIPHDATGSQGNIQKQRLCNAQEVRGEISSLLEG